MSFTNLKFKELGEEEANSDEDDNLGMVKALTAKLKLQTRRPSYLEWKDMIQSRPWSSKEQGAAISPPPKDADRSHVLSKNQGTQQRQVCGFACMDEALEWLRKELRDMQAVDHKLACQLMRLRSQIHRLKVEQACHQHKEMLDDAAFGLEGCEEDSDLLCNIPPRAAFSLSTPLKHIGVTRMNINSRRFSLC
ncbi:protein FAM167B isoform X1 [Microcaecilia unicolor]|uniref:Protein FAM167B isoform X1 n=1 Tax=Microcaecilia unicolor TaxID=1415580 RepID=A0A6P7ZNC7_9AMPH|nr:protein FAM167B isoform X1 [Microcaecilia unicolor]